MTNAVDRRSVGELLAAITNDLLLLGAQLFGIASAEGKVAAGAARNGAAVAIVGVGLVVCGALTLVSALVLVIVALGLSPWAAALAVGFLLTFGGAVALHVGVDMGSPRPAAFSRNTRRHCGGTVMAEKPPAVTSKSVVELRAEFDTTRARIAARVNEIDARLRTQVHTVVGTQHPVELSDAASLIDVVRAVSGLKGSTALVVLAGAVAGFVAMRRWAPRSAR